MKFATLATLAALAVGHVAADSGDDLTPSGIPPTNGPPFTSPLSFDTTAIPTSIDSHPSSLISSLPTSIVPSTFRPTYFPGASGTVASGPTQTTSSVPSGASITSTVASTQSGGARSLAVRPEGILLVLGAVVALVC